MNISRGIQYIFFNKDSDFPVLMVFIDIYSVITILKLWFIIYKGTDSGESDQILGLEILAMYHSSKYMNN